MFISDGGDGVGVGVGVRARPATVSECDIILSISLHVVTCRRLLLLRIRRLRGTIVELVFGVKEERW